MLAWWCGLLIGDLGSTVDLVEASELFWTSDILIWGKEVGAVSQPLVLLFITKLRGHGEEKREWLFCILRGVPFCAGLISFPEAPSSRLMVGLGRVHTGLGRSTSPLVVGKRRWEQSWVS